METELTRALRAHREAHPECDRHCQEYLRIAKSFTAPRIVWEGPTAPRTRLSVVEPR